MVRRGEIIDDDMEDEFYLRRLDAGLFVLQLICYIMAEICNANVPQVKLYTRLAVHLCFHLWYKQDSKSLQILPHWIISSLIPFFFLEETSCLLRLHPYSFIMS